MKKLFFIVILLVSHVSPAVYAQEVQLAGFFADLCKKHFSSVIAQFIKQKALDNVATSKLLAKNEFRCEESYALLSNPDLEKEKIKNQYDNMANALITITLKSGTKYWTIVHIHFSENGKCILVYPTWVQYTDDRVPKKEWCEFITSVFPNEMSFHGC